MFSDFPKLLKFRKWQIWGAHTGQLVLAKRLLLSRVSGGARLARPIFSSSTLYPSEGYFSDVRGLFRTTNPKKIPQNISYENCSHFWNVISKNHIFSISYIQKKTHNPNIISKISIYNTKYNKNTKIFSKNHTFRKTIFR